VRKVEGKPPNLRRCCAGLHSLDGTGLLYSKDVWTSDKYDRLSQQQLRFLLLSWRTSPESFRVDVVTNGEPLGFAAAYFLLVRSPSCTLPTNSTKVRSNYDNDDDDDTCSNNSIPRSSYRKQN